MQVWDPVPEERQSVTRYRACDRVTGRGRRNVSRVDRRGGARRMWSLERWDDAQPVPDRAGVQDIRLLGANHCSTSSVGGLNYTWDRPGAYEDLPVVPGFLDNVVECVLSWARTSSLDLINASCCMLSFAQTIM